MKQLTKKQKVLRWALNRRNRSMAHVLNELNYNDESQLTAYCNRLYRQGLINFSIKSSGRGKKIEFRLTKTSYYNRMVLI